MELLLRKHENMQKINRYTSLPVLLDMLSRKKLVLLDPSTWEDKNDSEVMLAYKKRNGLRSLLALCLSMGDETIHHWRTFADGISGCCIEFDRQGLENSLAGLKGVRHGVVDYKKISDLPIKGLRLDDMPFTKRWPYRCEEEYRIIWEGHDDRRVFEIDLDLALIKRLTISQRMPDRIYSTICGYLKDACASPDQIIIRSTLYQNDVWIQRLSEH